MISDDTVMGNYSDGIPPSAISPRLTNATASEAPEESEESDSMITAALESLNVDYSDNHDSAIGDVSLGTSFASRHSMLYRFVEENGRTYHRYKQGKYMMPNDEIEKDRLDLQHAIWLMTLDDELCLAPIEEPRTVLDIGTGTGIWAIEFANKYPNARVTGSDLSPIQPNFIPPNCNFEVFDAEDEWDYEQKFDFIHGRTLVTCFKYPQRVFESVFNALEPGGYFELQDMVLPMVSIDDTIHGTALERFSEMTMAAAAKLGIPWDQSANYKTLMEETGFIDVVVQNFQWPMNTWPKGQRMKMIGMYWQEDMLVGLEAWAMAALTRGGGMTPTEVEQITAQVRENICDKRIHAYLPIIVVYGRKPQ